MKDINFAEVVERSVRIRKSYHKLEGDALKRMDGRRRCISIFNRCWSRWTFDNVSRGALANRRGYCIAA